MKLTLGDNGAERISIETTYGKISIVFWPEHCTEIEIQPTKKLHYRELGKPSHNRKRLTSNPLRVNIH